jgi:hypothetical protein
MTSSYLRYSQERCHDGGNTEWKNELEGKRYRCQERTAEVLSVWKHVFLNKQALLSIFIQWKLSTPNSVLYLWNKCMHLWGYLYFTCKSRVSVTLPRGSHKAILIWICWYNDLNVFKVVGQIGRTCFRITKIILSHI